MTGVRPDQIFYGSKGCLFDSLVNHPRKRLRLMIERMKRTGSLMKQTTKVGVIGRSVRKGRQQIHLCEMISQGFPC